mgnify:CR=1 FL=1
MTHKKLLQIVRFAILFRSPIARDVQQCGNLCSGRQIFREHHVNGDLCAVAHGNVKSAGRNVFILWLDVAFVSWNIAGGALCFVIRTLNLLGLNIQRQGHTARKNKGQ